MGRRKIEIKAIKDDRNRSVTFLKRKGGLFKKAHELSVLCSVDVAVIIFGHNKKLYEFSSGDINETIGRYQYYGGAHEHKGPEDFMEKGGMSDDEDEDGAVGSPGPEDQSPPNQPMMQHHVQPTFQHIRHATPSASPPIHNGVPFHRGHTPQPQVLSRPSSRNNVRRTSSNLMPPHHPSAMSHAPSQQPSYAYTPNPPFYNPQAATGMTMKVQGQHPQAAQFQYAQPSPPMHNQVQQAFMQDQRRQSMPPAFPQQERPQPQQQPHLNVPVPSPPQPEQATFQSPPVPQPKPLPAAAKSHSIFTPIDNQSILAQHWGNPKEPREVAEIKQEAAATRSQSIDVASMSRNQANGTSPQPPPKPLGRANIPAPGRTASTPSIPNIIPPSRTNSLKTDAKPRLRVQIPSEQSDQENTTANSSPKETAAGGQDAPSEPKGSHASSVVLPPPSPSASALLSAGAQGPPNPFARPAPPMNTGSHNSSRDIETPISALPSRFMTGDMLPSPSTFYPEWGFGRSSDSNMLPSPLNFATPIVANGPSFRDEDPDRKRRSDGDGEESGNKRLKT